MTYEFKSVHDAHCCKTHGCKYGDDDCPVVKGIEPGIMCEDCQYDINNQDEKQKQIVKLEKQLNIARTAIIIAIAGSCTCLTKTPETKYHENTCRYRNLKEALEEINK